MWLCARSDCGIGVRDCGVGVCDCGFRVCDCDIGLCDLESIFMKAGCINSL